jgi:hypothetical protein
LTQLGAKQVFPKEEELMFAVRKVVIAAGCALMLAGSAAYAASDWLKGSVDEKLNTLANIQPGLGTVMIEYSGRYTNMYYAAKGGNWGLADYMLKEAREIQEVGETTRPARAASLKAFEAAYLDPLDKTIKAKNFKAFQTAFNRGIQGCNGCHAANGFPFIKYQLPKAPFDPVSYKP